MSSLSPDSCLLSPDRSSAAEVLVRVDGVSKIFCRDLKKSLLYGLQDSARDLASWGKKNQTPSTKNQARALRAGEFLAVDNVSFELRRGECLGLIGRNGAGKTTLLKMLNGLIKPDAGRIEMRGRVGALIALGAGFNPVLSGRENIYVNGSVLGLTKEEIDKKIEDIIEFAEIRDFIDAPVQSYSSGMQVRLGFAVATALEPDILILDEVLAVGDANFRSKCFQRIGSVLERCAVIFVSHDAYSVRRICNEVILLKKGQIIFQGDTEIGVELYDEANSGADTLEPSIVIGDYISDLTYTANVKESLILGDETATEIDIVISFISSSQIELGISAVNIAASGEMVVAQSLIHKCIEPICYGRNRWDFTIRNLHLARGEYSLVIGIFERNNKKIAINIRHQTVFKVSGSPRFGPHYAPVSYPNNENH